MRAPNTEPGLRRPRIEVVPAQAVIRRATTTLWEWILEVAEETGRCRIALSGGSTPAPIFEGLLRRLPAAVYPLLEVTWSDERHLSVDTTATPFWRGYPAGSNLRLAYEHWLGAAPAPRTVLPMCGGGRLEEERARFDARFLAPGGQGGFDGAIDIAFLGAGPDGHIASLFPDHPALEARSGPSVAVYDSPKPPPERLSLTYPVLERASRVLVVAKGGAKATALGRASRGDLAVPLGRLKPSGLYRWIVDPEAAAGLATG